MSVPYKPKPPRVKDKVRGKWSPPPAKDSGTLSGGHGTTAGSQGDTVPYKPKPPRKGRPDGA